MFRVEGATLTLIAVAIVRTKNDERLKDDGLLAAGRGTEDRAVGGDLTPAEYSETEVTSDAREDALLLLKLYGVIRLEKDIADSVLAGLGESEAKIAFGLALEELVRDTGHNTRTISIPTISTGGTSVGHGAEELPSIGNDFVALGAFDVTDEANAARVFFKLIGVKTLASGKGACPRLRIALDSVEAVQRRLSSRLFD